MSGPSISLLLAYLIPLTVLKVGAVVTQSHSADEETDAERLGDLPEVTQVVQSRNQI